MKKYKLNTWYPTLSKSLEEGQEVEYKRYKITWRTKDGTFVQGITPEELEYRKFWTEVKPLFRTMGDEKNVFPKDFVYLVSHVETEIGNIGISKWTAQEIYNGWNTDEVLTYLSHEKAIEYMWKNTKAFSYNDIARGVDLYGLDILEHLAKKQKR